MRKGASLRRRRSSSPLTGTTLPRKRSESGVEIATRSRICCRRPLLMKASSGRLIGEQARPGTRHYRSPPREGRAYSGNRPRKSGMWVLSRILASHSGLSSRARSTSNGRTFVPHGPGPGREWRSTACVKGLRSAITWAVAAAWVPSGESQNAWRSSSVCPRRYRCGQKERLPGTSGGAGDELGFGKRRTWAGGRLLGGRGWAATRAARKQQTFGIDNMATSRFHAAG